MNRLDIISKICERYDIALAYLFGSCAKQSFQHLKGQEIIIDDPLADIDIGVVFNKELEGPAERLNRYFGSS